MNRNVFAMDFGCLPRELAPMAILSDLTACIWSEELCGLLRLCGEKEASIGVDASQYDRFLAFCRCVPLLQGHRLVTEITEMIRSFFGIGMPVTEENGPAIWHQAAVRLNEDNVTPAMLCRFFLPVDVTPRLLCDVDGAAEAKLAGLEPVCNGNRLLSTDARDWNAWKRELKDPCQRFAECGCQTAFVTVGDRFCDPVPSVYHVDQCLCQGKEKEEDRRIKLAQVLRFLAEECVSRNWTLILRIHCPSREILSLLNRLERTVGLPNIIWSCADLLIAEALLRFSVQPHRNPVQWAISLSDFPSNEELAAGLSAYAARYPMGKLLALSHADLRFLPLKEQRLILQ